MSAAQRAVADRLRQQAEWCERLGSPLYHRLLLAAADDVEAGGPSWTILAPHAGDAQRTALALRFMGAVHRLVLDGRAPALARHYPSAGGDAEVPGIEAAFRATLETHADDLCEGVRHGVQTNEVGRSAALVGGFLTVAQETGLPLRILEVGASAGLNLRWDHFHYRAGDRSWGDAQSPVVLDGALPDGAPWLDVKTSVAERGGCDPAPLDPASPDDVRTLLAYLWPDQRARIALLRAAVEVARRVPAPVDQASAPDWIAARLAKATPGVVTVVYHSIVLQYIDRDGRARLASELAAAGARATAAAPLAWLSLEPSREQMAAWTRFAPAGGGAEIRLTSWPGGRERLLATAGFHGRPVQWIAS